MIVRRRIVPLIRRVRTEPDGAMTNLRGAWLGYHPNQGPILALVSWRLGEGSAVMPKHDVTCRAGTEPETRRSRSWRAGARLLRKPYIMALSARPWIELHWCRFAAALLSETSHFVATLCCVLFWCARRSSWLSRELRGSRCRCVGVGTAWGAMGKRKSAAKPPPKRGQEKLATVFSCPFCNHDNSVECRMWVLLLLSFFFFVFW